MRIYLDQFWRRAKAPFAIPLGPVELLLSMRRAVRVSSNRKRRDSHAHARAANVQAIMSGEAHQQHAPTLRRVDPVLEVAVIVGAGPGLGHGLAERLSGAGMRVAMASRNAERHDHVVARLSASNPWVRAYGCDATSATSVKALLDQVQSELGQPTLVVYAVQEGGRAKFLEAEATAIEHAWRANCLGGFLVAREAASRMVDAGRGTIVLVGATSGLIGRAGYINFATGKFGLRAVSQVAARELGPLGIHVAHLIIDADISEDTSVFVPRPQMQSHDIAELVYQLHRQPRSAWTQEMDARPHDERFWEHC